MPHPHFDGRSRVVAYLTDIGLLPTASSSCQKRMFVEEFGNTSPSVKASSGFHTRSEGSGRDISDSEDGRWRFNHSPLSFTRDL